MADSDRSGISLRHSKDWGNRDILRHADKRIRQSIEYLHIMTVPEVNWVSDSNVLLHAKVSGEKDGTGWKRYFYEHFFNNERISYDLRNLNEHSFYSNIANAYVDLSEIPNHFPHLSMKYCQSRKYPVIVKNDAEIKEILKLQETSGCYIVIHPKHIDDYVKALGIENLSEREAYKQKYLSTTLEDIKEEIYHHRGYENIFNAHKDKNTYEKLKNGEAVLCIKIADTEFKLTRSEGRLLDKLKEDGLSILQKYGVKKVYVDITIDNTQAIDISKIQYYLDNPQHYPIANITITKIPRSSLYEQEKRIKQHLQKDTVVTTPNHDISLNILENKTIHGYLDIVDWEGDVKVHNLIFTGEKLFDKHAMILPREQWARVRESFRMLKSMYDVKKNFIEGNKMYAMELKARAKEIAKNPDESFWAWKSTYLSEWLIFWFQNLTSKHSQSWIRVISCMIGLAGVGGFILAYPWNWEPNTLDSIWHHGSRLVLPIPLLHDYLFTSTLNPEKYTLPLWKQLIYLLLTIAEIYLLYQLIRAFRFYTKR